MQYYGLSSRHWAVAPSVDRSTHSNTRRWRSWVLAVGLIINWCFSASRWYCRSRIIVRRSSRGSWHDTWNQYLAVSFLQWLITVAYYGSVTSSRRAKTTCIWQASHVSHFIALTASFAAKVDRHNATERRKLIKVVNWINIYIRQRHI